MEFLKRKLSVGSKKTIKYRVVFKPLLKMMVDLDITVKQLEQLGIIQNRWFWMGNIDVVSLNNLCNYFGVPPHQIFEIEILNPNDLL